MHSTGCRLSNQTIRLHHNFQRLHDQDVSFLIYSVQGTNWQTVHADIHKHTQHKDTTIISFKNSILQLITPQLVPVQITLQTPTLNQEQRHRLTYPAIPPRMKLTPLGMAPGGTTLFGEVAASFRFSVSSLVAMVLAVGLVKEKCEGTAGQWPFIARGKWKAVLFRSLPAPVWDPWSGTRPVRESGGIYFWKIGPPDHFPLDILFPKHVVVRTWSPLK